MSHSRDDHLDTQILEHLCEIRLNAGIGDQDVDFLMGAVTKLETTPILL